MTALINGAPFESDERANCAHHSEKVKSRPQPFTAAERILNSDRRAQCYLGNLFILMFFFLFFVFSVSFCEARAPGFTRRVAFVASFLPRDDAGGAGGPPSPRNRPQITRGALLRSDKAFFENDGPAVLAARRERPPRSSSVAVRPARRPVVRSPPSADPGNSKHVAPFCTAFNARKIC